jgi:hypothetical protein
MIKLFKFSARAPGHWISQLGHPVERLLRLQISASFVFLLFDPISSGL